MDLAILIENAFVLPKRQMRLPFSLGSRRWRKHGRSNICPIPRNLSLSLRIFHREFQQLPPLPSQAQSPIASTFCQRAPLPGNSYQCWEKPRAESASFAIQWSSVIRINSHQVQTHSKIFDERQWRFRLTFYRCTNAKSQRKTIYDCAKCFTRFAFLVNHKHINKYGCSTIVKVPNPKSRKSLPTEIRKAAKSSFSASSRMLDFAQHYMNYRTFLGVLVRVINGALRGGITKLMAKMFKMTHSLKQQEFENQKPHTKLNYLSVFKFFVDYC